VAGELVTRSRGQGGRLGVGGWGLGADTCCRATLKGRRSLSYSSSIPFFPLSHSFQLNSSNFSSKSSLTRVFSQILTNSYQFSPNPTKFTSTPCTPHHAPAPCPRTPLYHYNLPPHSLTHSLTHYLYLLTLRSHSHSSTSPSIPVRFLMSPMRPTNQQPARPNNSTLFNSLSRFSFSLSDLTLRTLRRRRRSSSSSSRLARLFKHHHIPPSSPPARLSPAPTTTTRLSILCCPA
jgi:hypothetical protein